MKKYSRGDTAKFYFIINNFNDLKHIQAWSDDKDKAEVYMQFHKCSNFRLKTVEDTIENIMILVEENLHDEITVIPIPTRDRDSKKRSKVKDIYIPITETEIQFLNEEAQTFMATMIGYADINKDIPMLKDKYQKALNDILLIPIIYSVIHNKTIPILRAIELDYLAILYKNFPHNFGL